MIIFGLQNEREWTRFCQGVLMRPELIDDPRFSSNTQRVANDVWDHPQFEARNRWRPVQTPAGMMDALLPPATISGCEMNMGNVPALGEQTVSVLQGLSYSDADIRVLAEAKVT